MAWISADGSQQQGAPPPGYVQGPDGRWAPGGGLPLGGPTPEQVKAAQDRQNPPQGAPIGAQAYVRDGVKRDAYGNPSDGGQAPPMDPMDQARIEEQQRQAAMQEMNNKFNYGGRQGGATEDGAYYRGLAENAQNRPGEVINYGYARGMADRAINNANSQQSVADLMWKRASGQVPSIAQMQADRQMGQAAAEQTSAAASARGPAALALAQQGAAANTAGMQSNISNAAQINGAQERERAEQAAFGAFSGMRAQDYQGQGLEADMAQKQASLNAAQRAQNDAYSQGMHGNQIEVNKAQLAAQGNQVGIATGATTAANQLSQQASQYASDQTRRDIATAAGIGGTVIGGGALLYGSGMFGGGKTMDGGNHASGGGDAPGPLPMGDGYYTDDGRYIGGPPPDPSDVTSKQNIRPLEGQASAWDEGHRAALEDMKKLAGKSPQELKSYGDHPLATAVREMKAGAWDEGRGSYGGGLQGPDPRMKQAQGMLSATEAQKTGLMGNGPSVGGDKVTAQFAQGLAPSSYEYKDGAGTPGQKVGPMAQNMAANPITGTAIRQNPQTGLLGIDSKDGLKVALGGVGHLAKKQEAMDAEIANLRRMAAAMMNGTQAQSDGLMGQGPSVGSQYLSYVRGQ